MHTPLPARSRVVGILISCSLLGSLTGCGTGSSTDVGATETTAPGASTRTSGSTQTATTTATTANAATTTKTTSTPAALDHPVTVYFMNADATGLTKTVIAGPNTTAPVKAALSALAAATPPDGTVRAFPRGTEIIEVTLHGDEARVDLTSAFVNGYPSGGAAAELAVLAPIVYTATDVPGITHVRLSVNGEVPELPGSQFDWAAPFSRDDLPELPVSTQ